MASTAIQSPMTSSKSGTPANHARRQVQEQFETLPGYENPLVSMIGYGKPIMLNEDMTYKVIVDKQPPVTISLAAQVIDSGTTLTFSTTDAALLQDGQVLLIDDELVQVTTIASAATVGVERDAFGTTIATHITSSVVHILSPLYGSNEDFVTSPYYRCEMKNFYPFRIQYAWEADSTSTSVSSYLTRGKTDMDFEIDVRKAHRAQSQLERLLIYSKAQTIGATTAGAPDGIFRLITSNVQTVTGALTPTDVVDLLDKLYAHKGKGGKRTVIGNHKAKRLWDAIFNQYFSRQGEPTASKLGLVVDTVVTPYGEIDFMAMESVRDGELYVLAMDDLKIHPLDIRDGTGTGWVEFTQKPEELNRRATRKIFEFQGAFVMGDERLHGLVKGFSTTAGDYTNWI